MQRTKQSGVVSVIAMVMLSLFAALAVALVSVASTSVQMANNQTHMDSSRLQAEGGLSYLLYQLNTQSYDPNASGSVLLNKAYTILGAMNGSANLGSNQVTSDGSTVTVPRIAIDTNGRAFSATVTLANQTYLRIKVTGYDGNFARSVTLDCNVVQGKSAVFAYGLASQSPIRLTGNSSISGANDPNEASVLSATYANPDAVDLTGNCTIAGDVYVSNPVGYVTTSGNISIGGQSGSFANHIHVGVGPVDFPAVDPTVFEPFATNPVDGNTSFSGNKTFTNIRIKKGTNPTFSGNITLQGVVYIEQPNQVSFTGNLSITGLIVTQDAGDNAYTTNTIKFTGNTSSQGVSSLPNTSDFATLRTMTGSFLLAPGFGVSFTGNFGTVNGCMAASSFSFTGNAGGRVTGGIINYGNSQFTMTGNSNLIIDRKNTPAVPPGFATPGKLAPNMDTYVEN